MCTYFIDYENVGPSGFDGIELLSKKDKIILFWFSKIGFPTKYDKLLKATQAQVVKIEQKIHRKNSLDFKIVAMIGYEIGKNADNSYVIVSKDEGYRAALEVLRELTNKSIKIRSTVAKQQDINIALSCRSSISKKLRALDIDENVKKDIEDIAISSESLQNFYNRFINKYDKIFDFEILNNIYYLIKPILRKRY